MVRKFVASSWFPWVDLSCVAVALVLLEMAPSLGGWPLTIALFPWLLRIAGGQYPFIKTLFVFPLLIFLITAAISMWASYDSDGAMHKFWQLIGAAFLFLALAGQPGRNAWTLAGLAALLGVGTAIYFSMTNNWVEEPGGLGFMNQVGLWMMKFRPSLQLPEISHNNTAGVIAWSTPYLILLAIRYGREKKSLLLALAAIGGMILAFGFGLAFSRGTAISLSGGLLVWITWFSGGKLSYGSEKVKKVIFWLSTGMIGMILIGAVWLGLGSFNPAVFSVGAEKLARLELADNALKLASDAPLIGSGLNSFAGFYSTYLLNVPFYFFSTCLNQYVDVLFEQGPLGLLSYGIMYLGCLFLFLIRKPKAPYQPLWMGGVIGLILACVQGLSASAFYSAPGSLLAFLPPGLAYSMAAGLGEDNSQSAIRMWISQRLRPSRRLLLSAAAAGAILTVMLGGIVWFNRSSTQSTWFANLGVLEMAKVTLADFPSNSWQVKAHLVELQPARDLFLKSLAANPYNRAANYRLGMLSMNEMEYAQAAAYLEAAYQVDPNHRGVVKVLGYAYAWMGEIAKAEPLLKRIPEAKQELGTYVWWWGTQGRDDLAQRAAEVVQRLGN